MVNQALLEEIAEGKVSYLVPTDYNRKGPGRRTGGVFYNRQMQFNRDVCISFIDAVCRKGCRILDAMGATGIRSARIAVETARDMDITCNDSSTEAVELMRLNFSRLGLDEVTVSRRRAQALLSEEHFDYIDIDPFGTPVSFIPSALLSARNRGVIAVTATDAAVLCGSARGALRRYLCRPLRAPFMHEIGLRCLAGYIVRMAASYDLAATPLLSYFADHYFRLYVRIERGTLKAERSLGMIGYAHHDPVSGERTVDRTPSSGAAGPLWIGPLHDRETLSGMHVREWFGTYVRMERQMKIWREECIAPASFASMDELASRLKISMPERDSLMDYLSSLFPVYRTHLDPKGIRTAATLREVEEAILKKYGGGRGAY
ncbi:MAG: tRNA (guanine(26)-N(2))-dimethyltransferase [Candidatus Thermoplasmatota archaeon]|nr:tRNA (guanine(26)-N(2))-dimethyltransferase [Candidatus Thermoplasmatota archaeon]